MAMTRIMAIKTYFSTPEKPVTNAELVQLARADKKGFEEIGDSCLKALGEELATIKPTS